VSEALQLREAGDAALLLQLERVISPDVNARVIAIADGVRAQHLSGVRDVVSTFHSVAVYFDPVHTDVAAISMALRDAATTASPVVGGRRHDVPVTYGGEFGPDLAEVAAYCSLTPAAVIDRHTGPDYRVFMLGFQPGFAYMGLVDEGIAVPRRASPRTHVPAGAVGIAGRQTGVYPAVSPGGWRIIGCAMEPVFTPGASEPVRFAPGDTVRFRAVPPPGGPAAKPAHRRRASRVVPDANASRTLTVLRPGLFTTIQTGGRWGRQGLGYPVSGPMDPFSHASANLAVGNDRCSPALEVTVAGPELRLDQDTVVAVAGGDLSPTLGGNRVSLQTPLRCPAGSVLRFGERVTGARAYVAFDGGIVPGDSWPVTPLVPGQVLALGEAALDGARPIRMTANVPIGGARLRILAGPEDDVLPTALDALVSTRFVVSPAANRMGYRLKGVVPAPPGTGSMVSAATFLGAIQIPPSGEPILLMADRQTTGGYPQVAIVITADLPMAGQLAPGDWIEFELCSQAEARAALIEQEGMLIGET
jgi:KipI family sensor histidine kinase inhibitor